MYPSIDRLNRYKEELETMINNYQAPTPSKKLLEWRIMNENEEVDNLFVQNETLFISDNLMVKKGVDGKLEKWEVKKIYPIDRKDLKINELEEKIKELEMKLNESTELNSTARECNKPTTNDDELTRSKTETDSGDV